MTIEIVGLLIVDCGRAYYMGDARRVAKLAGSTQIDELGTIESPIVLTNTLSVGVAIDAVVYNSLLKAVDSTSNGQTVRALPVERIKELFAKNGR